MAKFVVTEFMSLDGVIEAPGGGEGYVHEGWVFQVDRGEEGDAFKGQELDTMDGFLLGRVTYEAFAATWPGMQEFASYNPLPKFVVSTTLTDPSWENTTVLDGGDAVGALRELKERFDGTLLVQGSAQLAQTLIEHDLADEIRLMVFPVVLGTGKKLFGETSDKKPLKLTESKSVGDGVQILVYERA